MMPRVLVLFGILTLATLGLANQADPVETDRRREFDRDADLIDKFVHGAVQISKENDPLKRAHHCNGLADLLAKEIQKTTQRREARRTTELSAMLQAVLVQGVADNLAVARTGLPADAPRSKEVLNFADTVAGLTKSAEQEIENLPAGEQEAMKTALQAMTKAREQVQKSSQGKGRPQVKTPQVKGKKNKK